MIKSVKSINPFKSIIQTIYDIITEWHGKIPIAYRDAVESKEGEGTTFKMQLSI